MNDPTTPTRPQGLPRAEESIQVVGFRVGDEEFAIDILEIVGVERLSNILQLPKMPSFVEGVMRIRDEIVPLVKLSARFGFKEHPYDEKARVIVIEVEDDTIGLIVDSVSSVRRFSAGQLEPAPPLALTDQSPFVRGVLRGESQMIVLLDPYKILFAHETRQLRSALAVVELGSGTAG